VSEKDWSDRDRPRRRDGVTERALPGELVVFDPESDRAHLLNRTAAAVWDLADGSTPLATIAAELAAAAGLDAARARADALAAVEHLAAAGLLAPRT
jgi:PqqD family protein of HPr-rel-A system